MIITVLSFAILNYPDGSRETVWLPDGNVMYFQGKHVYLVLMALLIILIRVPYTLLLFLWQWLVRAPNWKVFKWTRISKLHSFVSAHHIPYNCKYRYIGQACYTACKGCCNITASVTVFRDPQTSLLVIIFLLGILFIVKAITGVRIYKKPLVNVLEMDYTSTFLLCLLLVGTISKLTLKSRQLWPTPLPL